jgi:hypothetical protein
MDEVRGGGMLAHFYSVITIRMYKVTKILSPKKRKHLFKPNITAATVVTFTMSRGTPAYAYTHKHAQPLTVSGLT